LNVRNSLSLSNFLRSADGRSPLLCVLLALNPTVAWLPSTKSLALSDYLASWQNYSNECISQLSLILPKHLAYEAVARTPKDRPVICMAAALEASDNLRIACGGLQSLPPVLSLPQGSQQAFELVRQAYKQSDDAWASAVYRQDVSQVLLSRLFLSLGI